MVWSNITNLPLGVIAQIHYTNGIRNQISEDFRDWSNIKRKKVGKNNARSINFLLGRSYGASAVQPANRGQTNRPFPTGQRSGINEYSAVLKEVDVTVELEYNQWKQAKDGPSYLEPLQKELEDKRIAAEKYMSIMLHEDGTGIIGTVASVASMTAGLVIVTLSGSARGFARHFQYDEIVYAYQADAVNDGARNASTDVSNTYRVVDHDGAANTVTLQLITESTGADSTTGSASNLVSGDNFYRNESYLLDTPNISGDYNTLTANFAGLESLAANDGRVVHGITMSGVTAGSRFSGGGDALTLEDVSSALNKAKLAAGETKFKYSQLLMAPETHDFLINDKEESRRFTTVNDDARGGTYFVFKHRNDSLKAEVSEFCRLNRIWMIPESKSKIDNVLELHSSDFEAVKASAGQDDFILKPASGGGYSSMMVHYMNTAMCLIATQPNAIAVVENFTLS